MGITQDYSWTVNTIYNKEQDPSNIEIPLLSADLPENWATYDMVRFKLYKTKPDSSIHLYKNTFNNVNNSLSSSTEEITNFRLTRYTDDIFRLDIPSAAIYLENNSEIIEDTYVLYSIKIDGYRLIRVDIKNNLTDFNRNNDRWYREIYFGDTQIDNFWYDLFCVTRRNFLNNEYIEETDHTINETTLFYFNSNKPSNISADTNLNYVKQITQNYLTNYCDTNPIIYWNILFDTDNQFNEDTYYYNNLQTFNRDLYVSGQLYNNLIKIPDYIKTDYVCRSPGQSYGVLDPNQHIIESYGVLNAPGKILANVASTKYHYNIPSTTYFLPSWKYNRWFLSDNNYVHGYDEYSPEDGSQFILQTYKFGGSNEGGYAENWLAGPSSLYFQSFDPKGVFTTGYRNRVVRPTRSRIYKS